MLRHLEGLFKLGNHEIGRGKEIEVVDTAEQQTLTFNFIEGASIDSILVIAKRMVERSHFEIPTREKEQMLIKLDEALMWEHRQMLASRVREESNESN